MVRDPAPVILQLAAIIAYNSTEGSDRVQQCTAEQCGQCCCCCCRSEPKLSVGLGLARLAHCLLGIGTSVLTRVHLGDLIAMLMTADAPYTPQAFTTTAGATPQPTLRTKMIFEAEHSVLVRTCPGGGGTPCHAMFVETCQPALADSLGYVYNGIAPTRR